MYLTPTQIVIISVLIKVLILYISYIYNSKLKLMTNIMNHYRKRAETAESKNKFLESKNKKGN